MPRPKGPKGKTPPAPAPPAPSASAELAKTVDRVHAVFGWIINGNSQHDIEQAIEANWPGAKPKPLIVDAMTRIAKQADADPAVIRGWAIEATRNIYQKALEIADHQTALRALKQIVDLSADV